MRIKATAIFRDGTEITYPGVMRFAVVNRPAFGAPTIAALFANLGGARDWLERNYSFNAEVVALVRDPGDNVKGYTVQRDDNLDMMK